MELVGSQIGLGALANSGRERLPEAPSDIRQNGSIQSNITRPMRCLPRQFFLVTKVSVSGKQKEKKKS